MKNSQKKNASNDADLNRSAEERKRIFWLARTKDFEIPIPGLLRKILIPIWLFTLVIPIIILIFDGSLTKILYSFIPFLGLGILIFINIKLFCPKEIVTTEKGAYVMFRGREIISFPGTAWFLCLANAPWFKATKSVWALQCWEQEWLLPKLPPTSRMP